MDSVETLKWILSGKTSNKEVEQQAFTDDALRRAEVEVFRSQEVVVLDEYARSMKVKGKALDEAGGRDAEERREEEGDEAQAVEDELELDDSPTDLDKDA